MQVELHKLFYTPVWRFSYPDWDKDEEELVRHFAQDEIYISDREKNGLQITRATMHKDPKAKKIADFIQSCAEFAMTEMGYKKECGITSMWSTRQRAFGHHHSHSHANSFLGCAFHLFDVDGNASGTVFSNPGTEKYVIQPAISGEKQLMLKPAAMMPFIPGTLVMFPAWATHFTAPTECKYRIIVGANIMPIGMTNKDHFDRYNYPDPSDLVLKEYSPIS